MSELSHFNAAGQAHMVNVGQKAETHRIAVATGTIRMQRETLDLILTGGHRKGDVLAIARVAGIMGAKRSPELIPLCHPVPLTRVTVDLTPTPEECAVHCRVRAETIARTGVEMEALTAVQIALLTVYDMCKSVDRGMTIDNIRLVEKSGGKSGTWRRPDEAG